MRAAWLIRLLCFSFRVYILALTQAETTTARRRIFIQIRTKLFWIFVAKLSKVVRVNRLERRHRQQCTRWTDRSDILGDQYLRRRFLIHFWKVLLQNEFRDELAEHSWTNAKNLYAYFSIFLFVPDVESVLTNVSYYHTAFYCWVILARIMHDISGKPKVFLVNIIHQLESQVV